MGSIQLCIICGISPSAGPLWLLFRDRLDKVTYDITSEITLARDGKEYDEMLNIVREGLSSTFSNNERHLGYIPEWKPAGVVDWFAFRRCVAIGHFDGHFDGQFGGATLFQDENDGSFKVPSGRNVEVRVVDSYRSRTGCFENKLIGLAEDEYGNVVEMQEEVTSHVTAYDGSPNFFTSEGCYHYLQAWLDLDGMPPRTRAFPMESTPITFGGEFYEIVNARHAVRDRYMGTLNSIDYDGITATCVPIQPESYVQDEFYLARKGVKHIARGIRDGLRGKQLIPLILRDCQVWMFMRPDIYFRVSWPIPSDFADLPQFTSCPLNKSSSVTLFDDLPSELLLQIHTELPFLSCMSLWSTCKSLRTLLTDSDFSGRVLREAILGGHLRWVLPVESIREVVRGSGGFYWEVPFTDRGVPITESERANAAIEQWYKDPIVGEKLFFSSPVSRLLFPSFPLISFVCACFKSDSMRNRERIWNNVKQFETLWKTYRRNGWEVDRFYDQ